MNKIKYLAALLIGIAGLGFQQAQATTLDLSNSMHWSTNDSYLIGTVIPGVLGSGQAARDAAMTNTLLGMATPSQTGTWGDTSDPLYSRTTWPGGPAATTTGAVLGSGIPDGGPTLTITLTQTFQYLVVAYDGPNAGVAVFDVSSLAVGDQIVLSRYARPDTGTHGDLVQDTFYRMTSWTLLNPGTSVPDGGATVMLLGAGLGALGMVRRYLMSR
jgi:VPDSG-CTERM motif